MVKAARHQGRREPWLAGETLLPSTDLINAIRPALPPDDLLLTRSARAFGHGRYRARMEAGAVGGLAIRRQLPRWPATAQLLPIVRGKGPQHPARPASP